MAFDINTVTIVGRLTKDGEFSYTQTTNKALYKFSIANNTGGSKDSQDSVSYFDVVVWDKMAEICNQYITKGSQVIVTGRLVQRRFQDQQGNQRSKIEITASTVQFLSGGGERVMDGSGSGSQTTKPGNAPTSNFSDEDDIPF